MKKLAILGVIFLGSNSFAQKIVVENIDHNKVLYRGFENKLVIGSTDGDLESFQLEAINCDVSKSGAKGSENTFIVKTSPNARTAKINFISNGAVISSTEFVVQNLPSPELFWGNQKTGSTISDARVLQIKYPMEVSLQSNFEIARWKCIHSGESFEGEGNVLSQEILDVTSEMSAGEIIQMEVHVLGSDGITRKLMGSWVK